MDQPSRKIICITNRHLCPGQYWEQLEKIAASSVDALILREKDLSPTAYRDYAQKALQICTGHDMTCILHRFSTVAMELQAKHFHCSLAYLKSHQAIRAYMETLGVSIHTLAEAQEAEELGATYLIVGHVFPTACKPDSLPVGTTVLETICQHVSLPVYALGGISGKTVPLLATIPIAGIAAMSGFMTCRDVPAYMGTLT